MLLSLRFIYTRSQAGLALEKAYKVIDRFKTKSIRHLTDVHFSDFQKILCLCNNDSIYIICLYLQIVYLLNFFC